MFRLKKGGIGGVSIENFPSWRTLSCSPWRGSVQAEKPNVANGGVTKGITGSGVPLTFWFDVRAR